MKNVRVKNEQETKRTKNDERNECIPARKGRVDEEHRPLNLRGLRDVRCEAEQGKEVDETQRENRIWVF